jgi:phosphoribosylanthranilate isomerase
MFVKICGVTQVEQAVAIADLFHRYQLQDQCAIGLMAVPQSPRFLRLDSMRAIVAALPEGVQAIGVFLNAPVSQTIEQARAVGLTGVQLHGQEPVAACAAIRQALPHLQLIKAQRLRQKDDLACLEPYTATVDAFLIDAYHPHQAGGTGLTADWSLLQDFQPDLPWYLAGGISPETVAPAIASLSPDGIDCSSGVEQHPGVKDLSRVEQLLQAIAL